MSELNRGVILWLKQQGWYKGRVTLSKEKKMYFVSVGGTPVLMTPHRNKAINLVKKIRLDLQRRG